MGGAMANAICESLSRIVVRFLLASVKIRNFVVLVLVVAGSAHRHTQQPTRTPYQIHNLHALAARARARVTYCTSPFNHRRLP